MQESRGAPGRLRDRGDREHSRFQERDPDILLFRSASRRSSLVAGRLLDWLRALDGHRSVPRCSWPNRRYPAQWMCSARSPLLRCWGNLDSRFLRVHARDMAGVFSSVVPAPHFRWLANIGRPMAANPPESARDEVDDLTERGVALFDWWWFGGAFLFGLATGFLTGASSAKGTAKSVVITLLGGGIIATIVSALHDIDVAGQYLFGFSLGFLIGIAIGLFLRAFIKLLNMRMRARHGELLKRLLGA